MHSDSQKIWRQLYVPWWTEANVCLDFGFVSQVFALFLLDFHGHEEMLRGVRLSAPSASIKYASRAAPVLAVWHKLSQPDINLSKLPQNLFFPLINLLPS